MEIKETNLQFKAMDTRTRTERIILHHADASNCTAEQIHSWHLNNGWSGAGYHFLVRKDGSIYRLRPEDKVGAHAGGSNYNSIGICAEGKYMEETMPEAQKESLKELVSYLKGKYNITVVQAHRDVCATSCPGDNYPFEEIATSGQNCTENGQNSTEQQITSPVQENANMGNVIRIQAYLNEKYGTGIAVDNIYGNETRKALVKGLQKEINVSVDGIFGPVTKAHCYNIKKGHVGNIVYLIQAMLVCHGFNIAVDGIFGTNTLNAVKEFQRRNNLTVDGICGKNTFNCLFK